MAIIHNTKHTDGIFYTINSEKGDAKPFKVKLKPIDSIELVKLQDGMLLRSDNDISLRTGSYNVNVLRLSIVGWENMIDDSKKPIKMELTPNGTISDKSLRMIPSTVFDEIAGVAVAISNDPKTISLFTDAE